MDTENTNDSVQENLNITEPDPELLKSRLDDVFCGPVSPDPEDDAESINSIKEYQDVSSEAQASKAWADAKIEAEIQAGIKHCCSRCGTDSHTDVQCTASSGRNAIDRKSSDGEDSKSCKISIRKRKNFKRFRQDLHQVVIEGKRTDDLQYVMEMGDNSRIYAYFLLYIFVDFTRSHRNHYMFENKKVMALWEEFTHDGMTRVTAEDHLMWAYGKV